MGEEYDDSLGEYSPKSGFDKAFIIQESFRKIFESRSAEMKEGYYNFKFDDKGNSLKTWIPDTKKIYCSHVEAVICLLSPEIASNKRALEAMKEFDKKKKGIFDKYKYVERRKVLEGENWIWKPTEKEYLPKKDHPIYLDDPKKQGTQFVIKQIGLWNDQIDFYWDELIELCDSMFAELNILVASNEINYFKRGIRYG